MSCSNLQEQVVCEVRDLIYSEFAIEVMCDLLRSGIAGRDPRSLDVEVYMTEEKALFS